MRRMVGLDIVTDDLTPGDGMEGSDEKAEKTMVICNGGAGIDVF